MTEIKATVVTHEVQDGIQLLIQEPLVVGDNTDTDHCQDLAVLVLHLRYGDIKTALQATDQSLDDAAFFLKGG